jgi:tetratricopeptide (TPR) repeat protein
LLETAYSIVANMTGRIEEGVRHALEGQRLLLQAEDEELRALAPWTGAYPLFCAGQLTRSLEHTEALIESTRAHPEWGFSLWSLSALAWGHFMRGQIGIYVGNLETARAQIEEGVELARRYGDTESEGWALHWLGAAADVAGDVESGLGPCQRAVEIAEKIGSPFSRANAYYRLGVLFGGAGRSTEAVTTLEHALAIARECRTYLEAEALLVAGLAEACLGAGDRARARALAEESVALGRRIGAPLYFFPALRALAHVLLAEADTAAAGTIRNTLSEADRLIDETGATSLKPLVLLDRAELARLEGDTAARRRLLEEAKALFAGLGAPMRVQQIDALLVELR